MIKPIINNGKGTLNSLVLFFLLDINPTIIATGANSKTRDSFVTKAVSSEIGPPVAPAATA